MHAPLYGLVVRSSKAWRRRAPWAEVSSLLESASETRSDRVAGADFLAVPRTGWARMLLAVLLRALARAT
jgi:hypothetical protein